MAIGHFLLGFHNVMVTALGLYVKWLLEVGVVQLLGSGLGGWVADDPGSARAGL